MIEYCQPSKDCQPFYLQNKNNILDEFSFPQIKKWNLRLHRSVSYLACSSWDPSNPFWILKLPTISWFCFSVSLQFFFSKSFKLIFFSRNKQLNWDFLVYSDFQSKTFKTRSKQIHMYQHGIFRIQNWILWARCISFYFC